MADTKTKRVLRGIAIWLPTVLLGVLFVLQGVFKLQPGSPWPQMFEQWGYPAGSHVIVGILELAGGIALFVPRVASYAAVTLAVVMLGAAGTHLLHGELPQTLFTTALTVIFGLLARARYSRQAGKVAVDPV